MRRYFAPLRAVALVLPLMLGAGPAQAADIVETAEREGRFSGFLYLLEATGMADMLRGEGPFTVFAPTDEAFDQLPSGMFDRLLRGEDRRLPEAIIGSHIVADAVILQGHLLSRAVEVATIGGGTLAIDGTDGAILLAPIEVTITEVDRQVAVEQRSATMPSAAIVIGDAGPQPGRLVILVQQQLVGAAAVMAPDIEADNGVIHGIDAVLLPPEVLRSF